ncbi:zinc metalloprotease [Nocardioides sp. YIM 152588]|uniref:zinc metalloprotease n=1 Tax=Nocardioides sp. YIM 152588 TaxID=3158259 RepID=UPI0032E46598
MRIRPARVAALAAATVLIGGGTAAAPVAGSAAGASPAVEDCPPSAARVKAGSKAEEPALYAAKDAKKYGVVKDAPRMANGSVTIETVFHVVSDEKPSDLDRTRLEGMIDAQVDVLNASFSGQTAADAADSPFRFDLVDTTWTVDPAWAHPTPGKGEKEMKTALRVGDSETLNVYVADIGGGLLGWAYFPKGYNNGRDYLDGVVILDESMPGGTADPYNEGDTLTHEVGHWMMLEHTFAGACSASGDGVEDTPREAYPQFYCEESDSCPQPGLDPIHNFMDYTEDFCMDHFTEGQVDRMNDAWIAFRQGGDGGKTNSGNGNGNN